MKRNTLQELFRDHYEEIQYTLHPRKTEMENIDKMINCGKSALTIDMEYPSLKIQFLFTFLNLSHIFVTDTGKLVGVITKESFINKTKT